VTAAIMGAILFGQRAPVARLASGYANFISPWGLLGVLAVVVLVAVLFSAVQLTIALFARGTKAAQSYLAPLMIVVPLPNITRMIPGVAPNAKPTRVPRLTPSPAPQE